MEQFGVFLNSVIFLLVVQIRGKNEKLTDALQMCLSPGVAACTLTGVPSCGKYLSHLEYS